MPLSDTDVICAAQSRGESNTEARKEFVARFDRLLRYLTYRACSLCGLDTGEAEEVLQNALIALLDPATSGFDPGRGDRVEPYLIGLVQNAARSHARFVRKGDGKRHDWFDPDNRRRCLPTSIEDIPDPREPGAVVETRDFAAVTLAVARRDERRLVDRLFFRGERTRDVAEDMGIDRTTVSRRLDRFYRRVLEDNRLMCLLNSHGERENRIGRMRSKLNRSGREVLIGSAGNRTVDVLHV